jgi:hypothetical protein
LNAIQKVDGWSNRLMAAKQRFVADIGTRASPMLFFTSQEAERGDEQERMTR